MRSEEPQIYYYFICIIVLAYRGRLISSLVCVYFKMKKSNMLRYLFSAINCKFLLTVQQSCVKILIIRFMFIEEWVRNTRVEGLKYMIYQLCLVKLSLWKWSITTNFQMWIFFYTSYLIGSINDRVFHLTNQQVVLMGLMLLMQMWLRQIQVKIYNNVASLILMTLNCLMASVIGICYSIDLFYSTLCYVVFLHTLSNTRSTFRSQLYVDFCMPCQFNSLFQNQEHVMVVNIPK